MPFARVHPVSIAAVLVASAVLAPSVHSIAEPTHRAAYTTVHSPGARMSRARPRMPVPSARPPNAGLPWRIVARHPAPPVNPARGGGVVADAIRVIDGDTFAVGRQRFRLRGVDTPERGDPRWLLAARRLDVLLRAGPLTVVRHGEDVYGRTLVDVYVGAHDVAAILRRDGFDTRVHRRRR
jgi:endonuclease YncB( thermonuclease family)